jgi:hypothetical protein
MDSLCDVDHMKDHVVWGLKVKLDGSATDAA